MTIDLIKISALLALGYCLFFISWGVWTITDDSEVNELIEQGYIPSEYTHKDIFNFCNPQTESAEKALNKAPAYAMTCLTRGGWS